MIILSGKAVCGGIAFGKLKQLRKKVNNISRSHIKDTENEWKRFENAQHKAKEQLKQLYDKALKEVSKEIAMIFEIHQIMLDDKDFLDSVKKNITEQNLNAESAVAITSDNFSEMFSSMDDSYMQARAADVQDISNRILNILSDISKQNIKFDTPVIFAAEDLTPSETIQLDKSKILAFITEKGSSNSHTAILAKNMNIPAIVLASDIMNNDYEGKEIIADGFSGNIYIDPDLQTVNKMHDKMQQYQFQTKQMLKFKDIDAVTKDGREIMLYANAGSISDITDAYAKGAMGIGLFRSEFIYLDKNTYPTEDEQFLIYKNAAEKSSGKRIIIRTLDIGADKQADYFNLEKESNPALGIRGIRICLKRPEILKTQLKALYRASAFGKIAIMFPMITSLSEVKIIKKICEEVKIELRADNISFNENIEFGIMIETPAAAIISDKLAPEVDFFSIGTNDLTQYTLAIDRQNNEFDSFCAPRHTALLRLIKLVIENSHKAGIWTGICGELAQDTSLTELFLAMGVDELSVSPNLILTLKQKIIEANISDKVSDLLSSLD